MQAMSTYNEKITYRPVRFPRPDSLWRPAAKVIRKKITLEQEDTYDVDFCGLSVVRIVKKHVDLVGGVAVAI